MSPYFWILGRTLNIEFIIFFVGSSKKKAKHAAAQNALNLIQGIPNGQAGAGGDASTNSM